MPYSNVPEDLWGKMDSCVEQVMAKQPDLEKPRAIAICHAQIVKEKAEMQKTPSAWEQFNDFLTNATARLKAGARHSRPDVADLQTIHDKAVGLGAECMGKMSVVKQADGKLRWLTFSSTAYRDRDGEIVSTKALADDVARADATGDYGPLRFWHLPGVELGVCDYNALAGRILIESGTFASEEIGEAFKEQADEYEVSLGFFHPASEPDKDGVYNTIRRFERSPLPKGKASNLFTQLSVKESTMDISAEKRQALEKLVGKEKSDEMLAQAEGVQKQADAAGVAFKAEGAHTSDSSATALPAPDPAAVEKARKMADMMAGMDEEQYMAYMAKAFAPFIEKAVHAAMGAKKEGDEAAEKAANDLAALMQSLKESADAQKAIAAAFKALDERQIKISENVADLMGETPRAAKGFRASQDESTVRQKAAPAFAGPVIDESFGAFVSGQVVGK